MFNQKNYTTKAKNIKTTLKKLLKRISEYKILLIFAFLFAIGSTIFSIIAPKILGNATTEIYIGLIAKLKGIGGIDFFAIRQILIFLLIIYIISSFFSYAGILIITHISNRICYKLRKEVIHKLNKLPMSEYDKQTTGDILSIITNDIDTIGLNLNNSTIQIVTSLTTVIGIFIMMCTINVTLAFITLIILPISIFIITKIFQKSQKYFRKNQEYLASLDAEVTEIISGHTIIKAFNAEDKLAKKFENSNDNLYITSFKSQFLSGILHPFIVFISNLNYCFIAIIGAIFAIKGKITVGNIQSFIQYSKNFTNPISQIAQISSGIQSMIASSERVFNFLEKEEYLDSGKLLTKKVKGNIEFKNVIFGYSPNKIVINDFSINLKAGEKIAIVGPTGAGKTTIIKLLMRFYELNSGAILLDDENITNYKRSELEKSFAMVLQDTWLFKGTILDNLRYGNLNASDAEVIDAAKKANADYFIKTLPDGYNFMINESATNISIGEKQLLTIARAIVANPKILILDEATSNVDTRTEILIQESMNKIMASRTSFIIAHRLSTIRNADIILVMNQGGIAEVGTHDELLNKKGLYAKLYKSQFEK